MRISNLLIFSFLLTLLFGSCSDKSAHFSLSITNKNKSLTLGESLNASITNKKNKTIDSIVLFIDNQKFKTLTNQTTLSELPPQNNLGEHVLKADIYFENSLENVKQEFKLFNNIKPKSYTYRIVNTYPHDTNAFTQGLEFHNGYLYESTGRKGESGIRKIDLETGKVLQQQDLEAQYFGEGITILDDKIYQLTWQGNKGFLYDLKTFKSIGSFSYNKSKEGWGLCNNGTTLFKSDGTSKIWKLNPETLEEIGYIQATSHKTISKKLNELEWVNGKIYANNWQIDLISIINPESGAIEGLVDMRELRKQVDTSDTDDNVLNGIAYDAKTNRLFVTGKKWNKLFEIEIIEK